MSLLSSFLASHLIPSLEAALAAHEPEIQDAIISELDSLGKAVGSWVASKIEAKKGEAE